MERLSAAFGTGHGMSVVLLPWRTGELCFSTQPPRPAHPVQERGSFYQLSPVTVTFSELVSTPVLKSSYKASCQSCLHCSKCAPLSCAQSGRSWMCRWGHMPCHWPAALKENSAVLPCAHREREGAFCDVQVLVLLSSVRAAGVYRACLGRLEGEEPGCQQLGHWLACSHRCGP